MAIEPVSGVIFVFILIGGYTAFKIKTSDSCIKRNN